MSEFLSVISEPFVEETDEDAIDRLVGAVREFAEKVGVDNVRVAAHHVPFTAFEDARGITVLHHDKDEYSPERSWLSGHHKIRGFNFDMHSADLPMAALQEIADEDEPIS